MEASQGTRDSLSGTTGERIRRDDLSLVDDSLIEFVNDHAGGFSAEDLHWNLSSKINLKHELSTAPGGLADLRCLNKLQRINRHLERISVSLEKGQLMVTRFESSRSRKDRIYRRYPAVIRQVQFAADTFINRMLPKLGPTRGIYYRLKKVPDRILSETECLGRIASCGFDIVATMKFGTETVVLARKESDPRYEKAPEYGPVQMVRRIGRKNRRLEIATFRTTYPFAEFLRNGDDGNLPGKSTLGRWLTSYGLHYLPALRHILKRELKLVGVKALTRQEYNRHPEWLQIERLRYRPGLIQPHHADLPESEIEFFTSEANYLAAYRQKPIRTDIRYFLKAVTNVFIKKKKGRKAGDDLKD